MRSLSDFNIYNKRVLVRCDFNVPLDKKGNILNDFRIKKTLPTLDYLRENKAKIILMSHLDDPGGKVVSYLKMNKIAKRLSEYLVAPVLKADECIGPEVESLSYQLKPGETLLLENLRFYPGETAGDIEFAQKLSFLGDIYINEAFSVCHRDHASVTGIPRFLPSGVGFLLEKEIEILKKVLSRPERPMIALVGGKKVETKVQFINKILEVADLVIVNNLIASEIEEKNIALKYPQKIIKPIIKGEDVKPFDLNNETIKFFCEKIRQAKTILWNGPFGKFEERCYKKGTREIAKAIIESTAFSVVGGGETIEFLSQEGLIDKFNHVSTGGGAMLSFIAGEKMPGLEAIERFNKL